MKNVKKSFQYGNQVVTLETGVVARQASGAVTVQMGGTLLLVTVVGDTKAADYRGFVPLTVNYQERYYANGRLPGGFIKRESRPSVHETLVSRLIDRSLRPLFPKGFSHEVQVIATLLSLDPNIPADVPAMLGAAAAVEISGLPFNGPLAGARVGYVDGNYVLNPTTEQLNDSLLDLVIAGTGDAIIMVESGARELPEAVMLGAVAFGHREMQQATTAIRDFAAEVGKETWHFEGQAIVQELYDRVEKEIGTALIQAYGETDKQKRVARLGELRSGVVSALVTSESGYGEAQVLEVVGSLERRLVRDRILNGEPRIDGRDRTTVRPINIQLGVLPRAHGSALFTRGETQALAVATLGTEGDAQIIDLAAGESKESFMLHYNFPPYCTGEIGMVGSPRRREIGHGNLARRALQSMIPSQEQFPYVVRLVSEITESNGSSSMATVCGGSLALMDAGVPIKAPVAGVAMGLIKDGERFAVLTDILGDEDFLGDMDFKVAGTAEGVTALQMDIKINGITEEIIQIALAQAKEARFHILQLMQDRIAEPREGLSEFAPRITTIQINPEKIRDVIGKGGIVIRGLIEETGASIDVKDNGVVTIASANQAAAAEAKRRIELITADAEIGKVYVGKVTKILDFGAVVAFLPNKDGLVHISQIAKERVNDVRDYLQEGQEVVVKVLEIDRAGKIRLGMKELDSSDA